MLDCLLMKMKSNTLTTGLAIFSMFFGAGNVVFPILVGLTAKANVGWASFGMLIAGVGVPFIGLMSMTLFNGDFQSFFNRIGKWPGFIFVSFLMLLIGPFGATPRTIAISYSTFTLLFPDLSLNLFRIIACLIIFFLTYNRGRLLDILGYVLTPILLGSLAIICVLGIKTGSFPISETTQSGMSYFGYGLHQGYNMMDLLAAFFFSSVVIVCLKQEMHASSKKDVKKLVNMTMKAGYIGISLLGIVYLCMSIVGAMHSESLTGIAPDLLLGLLAKQTMGEYASIISCVAVSLACLTTAIGLCAVVAEFLHEEIVSKKLSYKNALIITVFLTFLTSGYNFSQIQTWLEPIIFIIYPCLIVLAIMNLLHKLYGVKWVKTPVAITLLISILRFIS